jgi:large subunit ribosomal protein L9
MSKTLKLLLTENVDTLGIVGDVVTVRLGYARNFLLPRNLATEPTEEALTGVAERRAEAQRQLAELRKHREELVHRLEGGEITIQRSCNDQGILYAAVTQQDIAHALEEAGYPGVKPRDVRLSQNIKRIDTYDVHVKFETDLEADIKLWVVADRKLDLDKHEAPSEPEQTEREEGEQAAAEEVPADSGQARPEKKPRAEKTPAAEKAPRAEKPAKAGKSGKGKGDKAAEADTKKGGGWGTPVTRPDFEIGSPRRRGRR